MSLRFVNYFGRGLLMALAVCMALSVITPVAAAQSDQEPAKMEVMGAYSYYHPGGSISMIRDRGPNAGLFIHRKLKSANYGFNSAATYFFNRYFGLTIDGGLHLGVFENYGTIEAGPTFRFPIDRATVFIHGLAGLHRIGPAGPQEFTKTNNGVGLMTGGGLDINITRHWSWRLVEADYEYAHHSYGAGIEKTNLTGVRLGSGIVYLMGVEPAQMPTCSLTADPTSVFAGEPVRISASATGINVNRTINYTYTTSGGKVQGTGASVTIDTTELAPGSYNVSVNAATGKRAGATCATSFTVNSPSAISLSCTANPSTVNVGGSSTIDCTCTNAKGTPTFKWSASAGTISGTGSSARLDTAGAQPGTITVSTTCTDESGKSASTDTPVTVQSVTPPTPERAQSSMLNEIAFKPNSSRVDNTAKAILDDVALRLQRETDARAVIVGYTDASEQGTNLAAQRAVNTKAYLVGEKGIDSSRIDVRADGTSGMKAEIYLVPAGASYDNANATSVDETSITPTAGGQAGHARRRAHHRRARKKAASSAAPAAEAPSTTQ